MNVIRHQFDKHGDQHLSDADLFELQEGGLPPARLASVQQHLFVCPECLRAFKDLSDFFTLPETDEAIPSNEQIEASWQELKEHLPLPETVFQPNRTAAPVAFASKNLLLPLAAGLLVTLGLAGLFAWRGRQTEPQLAQTSHTPSQSPTQVSPAATARPSETMFDQQRVAGKARLEAPPAKEQPQATQTPFAAKEVFVTSGEKGVADTTQSQLLFVPAREQAFSLKLRIYNPRDYRDFRVELLNSERKVVRTAPGKLTKDLAIEAVFQRAGVADGKYFVRVTGFNNQTKSDETSESVIEITSQSK